MYAISVLRLKCPYSTLILVFSGRRFARSSGIGHPLHPPCFCCDQFPGTICFGCCHCRSRRELVRRIQNQACGHRYSCFILHCLLHCYGVEVRIPPVTATSIQLISTRSAMFLIFRNRWGKIFNDDSGMAPFLPSNFRVPDHGSEVIHLVASILPLLSLSRIVSGLTAVVIGIQRAQGRQATGAVINFV